MILCECTEVTIYLSSSLSDHAKLPFLITQPTPNHFVPFLIISSRPFCKSRKRMRSEHLTVMWIWLIWQSLLISCSSLSLAESPIFFQLGHPTIVGKGTCQILTPDVTKCCKIVIHSVVDRQSRTVGIKIGETQNYYHSLSPWPNFCWIGSFQEIDL